MIKHLNWDSEHFGIRIGEIRVSEPDSSSYLELASLDYDLIYIYSDSVEVLDPSILKSLSYTEERRYYFKEAFNTRESTEDNTILIERVSAQYLDISDLKVLRDLAVESGKYSRFKMDPFIQDSSFVRLYHTWIDNSLKGEFDDHVFVSYHKNEMTGLVSCRIADNTLKIGLFAVGPSHQRKGIGNALLKKIEMFAWNEGLQNILIPTQAININACRFYKKFDYSERKSEYLSHLWFNQ